MPSNSMWGVGLAIATVLASGCAQEGAPPTVPSSAGQVGYAKQYPAQLTRASERYEADRKDASEHVGKLSTYPDALKDPDWAVVQTVYEKADEEGRGSAYAAARDEAQTVRRFYEDERKKLVNRVAGSTQHAAKEKGCDVNLYGQTDWALERGIDERLEERGRSTSDAHALIEAKKKPLGAQNVKTLTEQADAIMLASHVAHVASAQHEYELRELVDQASDARSALERRRDELKEASDAPKGELEQVEQALSELDPAVKNAEKQLEAAEQDRIALQDQYDTAFSALKDAIAERVRKAEDEAAAKQDAKAE